MVYLTCDSICNIRKQITICRCNQSELNNNRHFIEKNGKLSIEKAKPRCTNDSENDINQ